MLQNEPSVPKIGVDTAEIEVWKGLQTVPFQRPGGASGPAGSFRSLEDPESFLSSFRFKDRENDTQNLERTNSQIFLSC